MISASNNVTHALIICDTCEPHGGAESVAITTAVGLADMGIKTTFFCSFGSPSKELGEKCQVISIGVDPIQNSKRSIANIARGFWNRKAYIKLLNCLEGLPLESTAISVHAWGRALSPSIFSALNRAKAFFTVTLHEYSLVCANACLYDFKKKVICNTSPCSFACLRRNCDKRSYAQKVFRFFRLIAQRHILRNGNYITIAITPKQASLFSQLEAAKSVLIRNPISVSDEPPQIKPGKYFIFVGRLTAEKDPDIFCEAASELTVRAMVVGDGERMSLLKEKYPEVEFIGWKSREEVIELYKDAIALVVPSRWYEGAPLAVTEAQLSAGLPVIVANSCNAVDEITPSVTGYEFTTGDVSSLSARMQCLLNKQAEIEMKERIACNWKGLTQKYSKETYLRRLLSVYEDNLHNVSN